MSVFSGLVAAIDPSNTGVAWHYQDAAVSGGTVTSIPDCLGRSGRTLTGNGSPKPAYNVTNGITTDGSQNYLETGALALFDLSTGPITIIVACTNPTAGNFPVALYDPTFARLIGIGVPGASATIGVRQRLINGAQVDINTGITPDSGMHLHVFTSSDTNSPLGSTHGFSGIQAVPLPRRVYAIARSDVTTDIASGSNNFSIGNATGVGAYATLFRWAIVLRKDLSASDMDAIVAYAATDTAILPYSVGTKSIVAYGDSLLQGFNATTPATDNPLAQLVTLGSLPGFATANASIGGTRVYDWITYYPNQVATDYLSSRSLNIAWIGTGSNDLTDGTSPGPWDATGVINQYTTFAATLHARGFKVCIPTTIVRVGFTATQIGYKDTINAWLRSGQAVASGVADIVVDPASAPELQDYTNATYFNGDQTHLTTLGYTKYAVACQAGMAAGLQRIASQANTGRRNLERLGAKALGTPHVWRSTR